MTEIRFLYWFSMKEKELAPAPRSTKIVVKPSIKNNVFVRVLDKMCFLSISHIPYESVTNRTV